MLGGDVLNWIRSAPALQNGDSNVEAIIYPDAPHTLHIVPSKADRFAWSYMVPGYPELVIDWIKRIAE